MHTQSLQSCLTSCNPVGRSQPGFCVHGILQARILEWVALPSSRGFSQPKDQTHASLCFLHWQVGSLPLAPPGKLHQAGTILKLYSSHIAQGTKRCWSPIITRHYFKTTLSHVGGKKQVEICTTYNLNGILAPAFARLGEPTMHGASTVCQILL